MLALGLAACSTAPRALRAQAALPPRWDGSVDLGYTHVRQPGFSVSDGASLGALLSRTTPRLTLVSSGTAVVGGDGSTTALGLAAGAWRPLRRNPWQTELGATLTALGSTDLQPSAGATAYARQQWTRPTPGAFRGAWASAGGGGLARSGASRASFIGDVGAGWSIPLLGPWAVANAAATHVRTRADALEVLPGLVAPGRRIAYTDVALTSHFGVTRVDVDLAAGLRAGDDGETERTAARAFWTASGAWWIAPRTALVLGAGRVLADPTRGTASARYATLALRVALRPSAATAAGAAAAGTRPALDVVGGAGRSVTLRVTPATRARRVEVMGDFTEWQPVALERRGSAWEHTLALSAGPHRLLVRVNGGPWQPPANVAVANDDFGGTVGLIVVP